MQKLFTPENIKEIDRISSSDFGIAGLQLMENAASNAAIEINKLLKNNSDIIIFCGSGNNGGDGFAIARHLSNFHNVTVYWIGDESKMSYETKANFNILNNIGINSHKLSENTPLNTINFEADCIIDAFLGIGADENLRGFVVDLLEIIKSQEIIKIAIDNPSGLNPVTGVAHIFGFKADFTITMFAPKPGHYLEDGIYNCGEIISVPIGTIENKFDNLSSIFLLNKNDLESFIYPRKENSQKFDFGRLAIIAGSRNMSGAACLTANAAISSGCGLVHLATVHPNTNILPEIIIENLQSTNSGFISFNNYDRIKRLINKCNSLAIGPGIGIEEETKKLIREILKENPEKRTIIDADALKVLDSKSLLNENFIITPHTGEMSQITGIDRKEIEHNRIEIAKEWSKKLNCIILLKGKTSLITDGDNTYLNPIGNSGMATAGSGDVLTGIIASFLAQGYSAFESGIIGSLLHSIAGNNYIKNKNKYSLTASKLIDEIPFIKI